MTLASLRREWRIMTRHEFDFFIFFVTGRCNAACQHCFYWQNLGPEHAGLSLDKVEKLSASMPPFRTLLLSGGEPSLRADLPDLVEIFYRNNQIENASIPTNGLLPERIAKLAGQMATRLPNVRISFNLSLDGFQDTHDRIRAVPGNFDRIRQTMQLLKREKEEHPNLEIVVNTVLCADNWREVVDFAREVEGWKSVDGHFFEIIRGLPPHERMKAVPPDALWRIYGELLSLQEAYIRHQVGRWKGLRRYWRRIYDVGGLAYQYRLQWQVFVQQQLWDAPCMAGEAIAVVDYDGRMRVCELRDTAVSLEDYDFDFDRARESDALRAERAVAKQHVCDCTHVCFMTTSMRHNLGTRLFRIPWAYLRYKLLGW